MDELIDIANNDGTLTGEIALKSIIHQKGLFHHTAHLWLYTKNGDILLQQRAASKPIHPLLWDVSVAGHVDAGETVTAAAVRETKEEINLTLAEENLHKIGVFKYSQKYSNGVIDNEFHNTFIAELNVPLSALTCQPGEVEALKLVSTSDFFYLLKNSKKNSHFIASNYNYYKFVLKAIRRKLNT